MKRPQLFGICGRCYMAELHRDADGVCADICIACERESEGDGMEHHCENCNAPMPGSSLLICRYCVSQYVPAEFQEARRATDHEGETLFGDEERSRLRAIHDADLYRLERRKGFWLGAACGFAVGWWAVIGLQWLAEVLR